MRRRMTTPEPSITGELEETPFLHLVANVQQRAMTGTLAIWPDDGSPGQDRIYFEQGVPVTARLLASGSAALDKALLPLFSRKAGAFAFYEQQDLVGEQAMRGKIDPLALLAAALRFGVRTDVMDGVLERYASSVLRLRPGLDMKRYALLPKEARMIEVARAGPSTIDELSEATELGVELGRRLVYLLLITRALEPYEAPQRNPTPAQPVQRPSLPVPPSAPQAAAPRSSSHDLPPQGLSADSLALFVETKQRLTQLDTQNYFEMLGVARDVSADAIRKQYIQLAKRWHPDRLPAELGALRSDVEQIFQWMTAAHDNLVDDKKRVEHLRHVQDGGGTPEADRQLAAIVGAAMEQQKAEVLIRRRDFTGARTILERALGMNADDADLHATYAWTLFNLEKNEELLPDVIRHADRALAIAKDHDRAHFYKALTLRRLGREPDAIKHFKLAADANPKNLEALREVRLARMRGQLEAAPSSDPAPAKEEGLLAKLFGSPKKKK
jgi:curved DNA-binding protein CbpA